MELYVNLFYLLGITLVFINNILAKNNSDLSNVGKFVNNEDKYYLIYVNNIHGEYKIFGSNKNKKREESQVFIDSLVEEINTLIINNKNTYQNLKKLNEIEKTLQLKKNKIKKQNKSIFNDNEPEFEFVYPISSVDNRVVLYAYLSKTLTEKIKAIPNIYACVPDIASFTYNNYYNESDILAETGWKNMTVRENADLHLSIISQGKFNNRLAKQYDQNYYYPSSAGKDIDIVLMDSSFHFNYTEFSNTDERIVKCAANVENGRATTDNIDQYCGSSTHYHGESVSDIAGGLNHGVANLANIYGVSLKTGEEGTIENSDILGGLQFIYENLIRPHKTVINLSLGGFNYEGTYYEYLRDLVNKITMKGGIIVSAAGNNGKYIGKSKKYYIPCEFDNVICVGGIQSDYEDNVIYIYNLAKYSNHGIGVNIYAPSDVKTEILKDDIVQSVNKSGTSFSSPIIAGMIATIMSENPDIQYTKDTIYNKLYENGKSEKITYFNGSGFLANNGKHIVYSENNRYGGCGIYAGNRPCPSNKSPTTTTEKVYPTLIRKDGRCGPKFGYSICAEDKCCSNAGRCGLGDDFCSKNCKNGYGRCDDDKEIVNTTTVKVITSTITKTTILPTLTTTVV